MNLLENLKFHIGVYILARTIIPADTQGVNFEEVDR